MKGEEVKATTRVGKKGAEELETVNVIVRKLGTGKQRDKTQYFASAFR